MHKAVHQRKAPLPRGTLPPTTQEGSGAHSVAAPIEDYDELVLDEAIGSVDGEAREVLEAELIRVRAALAERDREIVDLKRRVALLEGKPFDSGAPQACLAPSDDARTFHPAIASLEAAAESPRYEPVESSYPILQRVAVGYATNSSVPPASSTDSLPPSQRRTPRRSCELELEFTEDSHFYAGLTQDISQGGVFIATYRLFPVGS